MRKDPFVQSSANTHTGGDIGMTNRRKFMQYTVGAMALTATGCDAATALAGRQSDGNRSIATTPESHDLCIFPIWESGLDTSGTADAEIRRQARKLKRQIGPGDKNNKIGFASIYAGGNLPLLLRQLKIFKQEGIHRGVIFAMQTRDLEPFTAHGCRALFPGWWHVNRMGKPFPSTTARWRGR